MDDYSGILLMLVVATGAVVGLRLAHRATAVARDPLLAAPFLSGHPVPEHALSRFHARWYPVTLVFLAFDVEMLFMYPWTVVVLTMGGAAVIEMFLFLGVLLLGVLWAWREGAFRWV